MKFYSWNVNGVRAAWRKDFGRWFEESDADFVSIQETRARPDQLTEVMRHPQAYHSFWHSAEKPGYSGVAIFTRREPLAVREGLGDPVIDREGRVLTLEYEDFALLNGYFPHVRHDLSRLDYKLHFCEQLLNTALAYRDAGKALIICGDYNIAHRDIDLANPKANRKNAGFLPQEKAWMDRFLAAGWRDVFRDTVGDEAGHYTWWSFRKGVRERNVGWRIDYHCVDQSLSERVTAAGHCPEVKGSDHCPVFLELKD